MGTLGISQIIRYILLMISFGGYSHLLHRKFSLKQELCPAVTLCLTGCILFPAGCIGLLIPVMWIVFIAGLLIFPIDLLIISKRDIRSFIKGICDDLTFGTVAFYICAVYLFIWLAPVRIYYFDNFTHWRLITKFLLYNSHFPTAADPIIEYSTYPVGSSVFIWYVCKIIGTVDDGQALFAQSLLSLSCGITIFSFTDSKDKKISLYLKIIALLFALGITTCYSGLENGITSLLVDRLLSALGIAAFSAALYNRDDIKKAVIFSSPIAVMATCVKASGIFFALTTAVLILYLARRKGCGRRSYIYALCSLAPAIVFTIIWKIHTSIVFKDSSNAPHAISKDHYSSILSEKTPDNIRTICRMFAEEVFLHNIVFVLVAVAFLIFVLLMKVSADKELKKSEALFYAVYLLSFYILYQLGNLAMYIFSMPWIEAQRLCWYQRYVMTIDAFSSGIILIFFMRNIGALPEIKLKLRTSGLVFMLLPLFVLPLQLTGLGSLFIRPERSDEERLADTVRSICEEYELPQDPDVRYLVCFSENEAWLDNIEPTVANHAYRYYFCKTILYSADLDVTSLNRLSDIKDNDMSQYDCFIYIRSSQSTEDWRSYDELSLDQDTRIIEYTYDP